MSTFNNDNFYEPNSKKFKTNNGRESATPSSSTTTSSNVFISEHKVNRQRRGRTLDKSGQFRGCVVWFTGLSGAGKSTISMAVEKELVDRGYQCYVLDGDNVRRGLCKDLGFSAEDRKENIRRTIEAAKLLADSGQIVLCSLISPRTEDRKNSRDLAKQADLSFFEVFVDTPLEECKKRDTKGLYEKALKGEIKDFTGIHQAYEEPQDPELSLKTVNHSVDECVEAVVKLLKDSNIIPQILPPKINGDQESLVKELFIPPSEKESLRELAKFLPSISISKVDLEWVQVLSEGWAFPLTGFMREDQYIQSLHFKCVSFDGKSLNQSIPIVLPIDDKTKNQLVDSNSLVLKYNDCTIAVMQNIEVFAHRKEERIARQFGTSHPDHPYIKMINDSGDWLVGGDLKVFERIKWNDGLDEYRLTPNELKHKRTELGADVLFAFQLRNPIHNGHALLIKDCRRQLEEKNYKNPTLLLHPLGGHVKNDDVPLDVRMKQHKAILDEGVLDPKSTILAIFPSPMMYAGPTEVQWHAKARLVAGCEYYIVGRDPAGIKHPDGTERDLYDFTHGGRVLAMAPGLEGMTILKFKPAAYDTKNKKMAFVDEKRRGDFLTISGTKMREYAKNGKTPEDGFMAPKAWEVLEQYYKSLQNGTNGVAR